jgi:hypothetical protein
MKNDKPMNSLNEGMEMWMEYAKAYTDFVVGMNQNAMKAMTDAREQFDRAANEAMTKSLKLGEQEQHMATEMINAFQDQARKMWDNNVKFMEMAMSSNKTMADQMTSMMENAAKRN